MMFETILVAGAGGGVLVGALFEVLGWNSAVGVVIGSVAGGIFGWWWVERRHRSG